MRILALLLSELSHETRLERMAESLEAAGHQLRVTRVDNGLHPPSGFWRGRECVALPNPRQGRRKSYFLRFMRQVYGLIAGERPEAVLAVDPPALLPAALRQGSQGYRLVYDSREYYCELPTIRRRAAVREFWRFAEGYGMRRAQRSFAVGPRIARALAEDYECPLPSVLPNTPRLTPSSLLEPDARCRARQELCERFPGLRGADRILLYQGGFWPGYDFGPLFHCLASRPEWHLLALGDGPGHAAMVEHAAGLSHGARLHLPGKVPSGELPALSRGADAGVIPVPDLGRSYRYLMPNKLFEYIQADLPLLASGLPELEDVIQGEGLGELADCGSADSLGRALDRLGGRLEDPVLRDALAAARRKWCWEKAEQTLLEAFA